MAITAHWCAEVNSKLTLKSALLAFRYIPGSHTGVCLATHFVDALRAFDVLENVRDRTFDF